MIFEWIQCKLLVFVEIICFENFHQMCLLFKDCEVEFLLFISRCFQYLANITTIRGWNYLYYLQYSHTILWRNILIIIVELSVKLLQFCFHHSLDFALPLWFIYCKKVLLKNRNFLIELNLHPSSTSMIVFKILLNASLLICLDFSTFAILLKALSIFSIMIPSLSSISSTLHTILNKKVGTRFYILITSKLQLHYLLFII